MTELFAGWNELVLTFALFFLSHIIPVRPTIRNWLIRRIGKTLYLGAYSALSIFLFDWLTEAAGRSPYLPLWPFDSKLRKPKKSWSFSGIQSFE